MAEDKVVDQTDTDVEDQEENKITLEEAAEKIYGKDEAEDKDDKEESGEEADDQESAKDEKSEDDKDDEDKDEGAPDQYEFKMPEGMEEALDEDTAKEFSEVAKELGLTQDQAQKVVDVQVGLMNRIGEKLQGEWSTLQEEWRADAKSDKEFGGEKFQENLGYAVKAIDTFGSEALKEALEVTGMGNHPELVRFCISVGKMIGEDGVMSGGKGNSQERDPAKTLFPDMA